MNIGYCKLGRSWNLDIEDASTIGGDVDVIRLLHRLSKALPDDKFILVGRNSGQSPIELGYESNVVNPWQKSLVNPIRIPMYRPDEFNGTKKSTQRVAEQFLDQIKDLHIDKLVMWVGQHGMANSAIPMIGGSQDGPFTNPQMSFVNYCSYLIELCNTRQIEPILLVPDVRNYIKMRDLRVRLTHPVLAQYKMKKTYKQDFGGAEPIISELAYIYSGLELTALDDPENILVDISEDNFFERKSMVVISNENRDDKVFGRADLLNSWVFEKKPKIPLYGSWSKAGLAKIKRESVESVPLKKLYSTFQEYLATITLPASGSGWATSKAWECFANGVVCFMHPKYDSQDHILKEAPRELANFIRVYSPFDFHERLDALKVNKDLWIKMATLQRQHFEKTFAAYNGGAKLILERLQQGEAK